ncbi:MAG TPA: hypothetical protein VFQ98_02560 [Gallionella sp.]|nr:hypothetical protein [Gallionella sp.]
MNYEALAKAVVMELFSGGSVWFFLFTSALFAGVGAYFGKYFGTKGANLATREDFNALLAQLSASTRLVESVKSEIARTDWVAREWATLRIKKIEELMTILHECEAYLDAQRNSLLSGNVYLPTPPFDHAIAISELYLPELCDTVNRFILSCRRVAMFHGKVFVQQMENEKNGITDRSIWDNLIERNGSVEMLLAAKEARQATSQLVQKIISDKGSG